MPKPIGNQSANLKSADKVSRRVKARFGSSSHALTGAAARNTPPAAAPAKATRKFKARRK